SQVAFQDRQRGVDRLYLLARLHPVQEQIEHYAQVALVVARFRQRLQRLQQVGVVFVEGAAGRDLALPAQTRRRVGGAAGIVVGVGGVGSRGGAGRSQFLLGVLADRLEQPITGTVGGGRGHHQRLVDERVEEVHDVLAEDAVTRGDVLGGGEVEASGEHRQAGEDRLLGVGQEIVGPVDGGLRSEERRVGKGGRCGWGGAEE